MLSLVSLLVAAALVSQHSGFEANALIDNSKLTLDNNLQPNVIAPPKKQRHLKKMVRIWKAPVEEVRREATERVELECVAMGNPIPSIRWLKNGETIQEFNDEVNEILPLTTTEFGQVSSKLVITSTTPGEDRYTCQATAGLKRQAASSVVFTLPMDEDEEEVDLLALQKIFIPFKPTIIYSYKVLLLDEGSVAVLPCRVHSITKAQVFWQDRDERLIYGNSRIKVLPSGDLLVTDLQWADMGNFTCVAQNVYGKDTASVFVYPTKV